VIVSVCYAAVSLWQAGFVLPRVVYRPLNGDHQTIVRFTAYAYVHYVHGVVPAWKVVGGQLIQMLAAATFIIHFV